jgi:hypothetical protein
MRLIFSIQQLQLDMAAFVVKQKQGLQPVEEQNNSLITITANTKLPIVYRVCFHSISSRSLAVAMRLSAWHFLVAFLS